MVEDAVGKGDIKKVAAVIQSDPVISLSLINYANAARFIGADKTASVRQAVVRLGMVFVQRVVFVAAMMMRYQKGRCPEFNYSAYWMNALATGAAMRALLPDYGIPESMADDAHATGLVSNIGWLAVAETYPALMTKYLQRCRRQGSAPQDPPAERDLSLPDPAGLRAVSATLLVSRRGSLHGGRRNAGHHNLGECLARATRVAQKLAPLNCLAVLPMTEVPAACQQEWDHWQTLLKSVKR